MVEEVGFDSAFTFVYSPRQGTDAAAMADQVPHEVKIERMERLVELTQRIARERNAARVGRIEQVLVEGPSRTDETLLRGRTRRNTTVNFSGDAAAGRARRRPDRGCDLDDAARQPGGARPCLTRSSILLTGSSGQIGTNLALRLQREGYTVWGVDKRVNTWTDDFKTLYQDLAGHYAPFRGGMNGVEYPEVDLVVHLAAHAKVHQLVRQPQRALENAMMTFNILEYCRQLDLPLVFSSTREVYGDVHRFDEYGEAAADFAYTESPYSASKIAVGGVHLLVRQVLRARYLVFRFSNVYGRYDNDLQRMERVIPLSSISSSRGEPITVFGGDDKVLDFTYIDDCIDGITRGVERLLDGRVVNETINLAYGQGNTLFAQPS